MIDAIKSPAALGIGQSLPIRPAANGVAGASAASQVAAVPGQDFTSTMSALAANALDTMKTGEAASIAGVEGKASAQRVVEAVMAAEQTLNTTVAVRNKVVEAYQEISRMAI